MATQFRTLVERFVWASPTIATCQLLELGNDRMRPPQEAGGRHKGDLLSEFGGGPEMNCHRMDIYPAILSDFCNHVQGNSDLAEVVRKVE